MSQEPVQTSSESPDLTGRELGDYVLLRRLGRGGMADVYLARQDSLRRNVALKILKPDLAKDSSYVQRFRQEAQAAAGLVQANIVQIYEVGEEEGFYFISQEYVQGRNLGQYLARHGAVEPVMAINVLRQSALALQEAGKENVIHRDIKPENIMLSTKGEVKITDFGLARIQNSKSDQALTQIGVTMGTPLYMSPEQVEGNDLDQRSDIYSLGVTAYHMLAGEPPFTGDNALSIAVQHVKDKAVPLEELRPDVPKELCEIINRMMAKQRTDRPDNAKSLLTELRKIKIDVDDDWDLIVEKLAINESPSTGIARTTSFSEAKLAATRQLQNVMRGNVRSWWKSTATWAMIAGLSLAGLLGGIVLARQTPPAPLLEITETTKVPKKSTAADQYQEALSAASSLFITDFQRQEQMFLAVGTYFPVNQDSSHATILYNRYARARLAEIYLKQQMFQKAEPIFDEFIGLDPGQRMVNEFKAIGYTGKALVLQDRSAKAPPDRQATLREKMGELVGKVKADQLNEFMRERFEQLLRQLHESSDTGGPKNS